MQKNVWLYSVVGVVALLFLLIGINLVAGLVHFRGDLTQGRIYTLSSGTRRILEKLDTPVDIRFYFSRDEAAVPVPLRTYAQQVENLLSEYQQASGGKIRVRKLDPRPDSDAEDSANLDGIQGQPINLTDKVYFGIAVSCLDAKATIPYLSPDRETLLEYDLSRAVSSVASPAKAVIGVMSALPVTGQSAPMMMMQRQEPTPPWIFLSELRQSYEIRNLPVTTEKIDDAVSVLLLVHPQGITEQAQFAIDQFLLKGGKVVALLDPLSFVQSQTSGQAGMMGAAGFSSTLDKLLPAWGLQFDPAKVLVDPEFATQIQRQASVQADPSVLSLTGESINKQDPLGAATSDVLMPYAGALTGTPKEGLKEEVLIRSSDRAKLVDAAAVQMGPDAFRRELKGVGTQSPLAVRLTGKFSTAFPNGQPAAAPADAAAQPSPSPSPKAEGAASPAALKEATKEGVVILIGDSDFAYDAIAGRSQALLNQTVFVPTNGNLNFIQSAVEQLAGDSNLMAIRSRASASRPFTVVNEMQAAADAKYQSKIQELEDSLSDTRQKLAELQATKQGDQKLVLSPEQEAEIKKFQENEAKVSQELRQLRKDLRREIDSLENGLKWFNIAAVPLLVTAAGVGLALVKRRKRAAK
jgi:ABC-type uncharacterized transport system involved in gliding motility auxiliary subunit